MTVAADAVAAEPEVPNDRPGAPPTPDASSDVARPLRSEHDEPEVSAGIDHPATALRPAQRLDGTFGPTPITLGLAGERSFVPTPTGAPLGHLPDPVCAPASTPAGLSAFFDGGRPMIGADYQRAFPLPSGRVLWLFQDAFLPTPHGPELVHDVALLQSGQCFQLLRSGSADAPTSYLFPDLTDRYDRWFWPLGGDLGTDGDLHVFVAEMIEHGGGYLVHTEPVATWLVTIDADDLGVVDRRPAPDASAALYGWSAVSGGEHTYLYSHCYRQFGYDPLPFAEHVSAHDLSCTADVKVARIPRGAFGAAPEYWNGVEWVADPAAAVAVIPTEGRSVNPTQVALLDGRFVAATKVDDWWGEAILLDVADSPEGPWHTYDTIPVETECDDCNTYFASIVPFGAESDSFVVGLSCNTWGGDGHDRGHYTPTFLRAPAPADSLEAQLDSAETVEVGA